VDAVEKHQHIPAASFDGGALDCGSGLLLLIRKHIDVLNQGQLLEICSTEGSVEEDLPAWCRLTNNELISWVKEGSRRSFLVSKGPFMTQIAPQQSNSGIVGQYAADLPKVSHSLTPIVSVPVLNIEPLSVMGIGSWPRPRWLMRSLHEYLEGKIREDEFQEIANDAVRLSVQAQMQSGVDVITDGEQRRDNYSSFVGNRLDGCQLVPLQDLLSLVDDPAKFEAQLKSLDVPADKVRHPAVLGKLGHNQSLVLHEFEFLRGISKLPAKIALPGPYLLTRTMWMDCLANKPYASREELAVDITKILAEEIHLLMAAGVSMVQLDEPVLTEVVFGDPKQKNSFMCGALSERLSPHEELAFAVDLINKVIEGVPRERVSMHVCRGNWTPDESVALKGDYLPLVPVFHNVKVGTFFLEFCTPRAGDMQILRYLPTNVRVGIGLVNPKDPKVENPDDVLAKARTAAKLIGEDRLLLTPDCGFATFADNPVSTAEIARAKLAVLAQVAQQLKMSS
jgi:5-methyltetrahydropteroyltriglutamate--homocysteine methyltransferase